MNQPLLAICKLCAHQRTRPKPALFSQADLRNPEVLKARLEWEQKDQQRKFIEQQRFEEGRWFDYEPFHYPWCAAFTPLNPGLIAELEDALADGDKLLAQRLADESQARALDLIARARAGETEAVWELAENGLASMDPVSGEIQHYYALCNQMNPSGQCPLFTPRRP